jgi:hypothetical protein
MITTNKCIILNARLLNTPTYAWLLKEPPNNECFWLPQHLRLIVYNRKPSLPYLTQWLSPNGPTQPVFITTIPWLENGKILTINQHTLKFAMIWWMLMRTGMIRTIQTTCTVQSRHFTTSQDSARLCKRYLYGFIGVRTVTSTDVNCKPEID